MSVNCQNDFETLKIIFKGNKKFTYSGFKTPSLDLYY